MIAARREDRLAEVAASIPRGRPPALPLRLDVTAPCCELEAKVAEAARLLDGPIDVLVCSSGVGQRTAAVDTDHDAHERIMATNFGGSVALTRALLPSMLARQSGTIVVVSSVQGFFGQPYRSSYAASKAACHGYFDALRSEVASSGVRVTLLAPGYIDTEHSASAVGGDGTPDENAARGTAPGKLAAELADAVASRRDEVISAPLNARAAIWLRALWPSALFQYMRRKA